MTALPASRGPAGFLQRCLDRLFGPAQPDPPATSPVSPVEMSSLPLLAPPIAEAEKIIADHINLLADNGALDDGSGHVLDGIITSWVRQWADVADGRHQLRLHLLRSGLHREELNISRYDSEIERLDAALKTLDEELEYLVPAPRRPMSQDGAERPDGFDGSDDLSHTRSPRPSAEPEAPVQSQTPQEEKPSVTKPYDDQRPPPDSPHPPKPLGEPQ